MTATPDGSAGKPVSVAGTVPRTRSPLWLRLSIVAAVVSFLGSVVALADPRIYRGLTSAFLPQALAQDAANLGIAPLLIVVAVLSLRGSVQAYPIWLGVVAFCVYNYLIYTFSVPFGPLFFAWSLVLGLSLFSLIGGLHAAHAESSLNTLSNASDRVAKVAGWVLLGVAVLFGLLWLSEDLPALISNSTPRSAHDLALPTNPVHVLDYVFFLPAAIATGVGLLRRSRFAFATAPAFFVFLLLTCVPILVTPLFRADVATNIVMIVAIGVLAVVLLTVLALLLGSVRPRMGVPVLPHSRPAAIRILVFVLVVVVGTSVVIVAARQISGSWAVGATAGVIAGIISSVSYPLLLVRRAR